MADVFISYSRVDQPFVRKLGAALAALKKDVWADWEDIPPTSTWLEEIQRGIEAADTFLFVIAPESVTSDVCRRELDHAVRHNKRIVPVLRRKPASEEVPEPLASRNWIFFQEADDFDAATRTLVDALDTDLDLVRAHTRLLTRAIEWDRQSRDRSLLLRGHDLEGAERWLTLAASGKSSTPTPLQGEYVGTSRRAESRRQRTTLGAAGAAVVVTAGLAIAALMARRTAIEQRDTALSRQLAAQSGSFLTLDPQLSLLLASEAARITATREAEEALRQAALTASQVVPKEQWKDIQWAGDSDGRKVSPDGRFAASGAANVAVLREAETGRILREFRGLATDVEFVRFSADGRFLEVEAEAGLMRVWRVAPLTPDAVLQHAAPVRGLAVSPEGTRVLTMSDRTARVWDVQTGRELTAIPADGGAFGADGSSVVTFADASATIWDGNSWQRRAEFRGHGAAIRSVAFNSTGSLLVTASADGAARVWDVASGSVRVELKGHSGPVLKAVYSRDGSRIATRGDDNTVRVWDAATGHSLSSMRVPSVLDAAFSPDGSRVLTASEDGTARIWDAQDGAPIHVLQQTNEGVRTAFSPNGRLVITGSEDIFRAMLWDAASGHQVAILSGLFGITRSVGFSPNSRWALTASGNGAVRVWDPTTARVLLDLRDHTSDVRAAAFGPDSKLLVTAGDDRRVFIYRCEVCGSIDDLQRMASRLVTRPLTPAERLEYLGEASVRK